MICYVSLVSTNVVCIRTRARTGIALEHLEAPKRTIGGQLEKSTRRNACNHCGFVKYKHSYAWSQWNTASKQARCNLCKSGDEREHQRMRRASATMVMKTQQHTPVVSTTSLMLLQVCCSTCRTNCCETRCKQCFPNTRIGLWLRCQDKSVRTISGW